ncbi:MAG: aromatic ring-hydroxylating dioxygenase subunit alpha [Maricaulaceae bacterium]|nr:aromatic ring-hydroxylating dioxygenase subunit alpha [Maricaulaceae bacterium]
MRDGGEAEAGAALPASAYTDPGVLEREAAAMLRPAWQLVCHLNDIPETGDYVTLDFLGDLVFALRGADGEVRVFRNVCRHRGARLVDGGSGRCGRRVTCPYHAWSYELDGRLSGVPDRGAYEGLDPGKLGLIALETGQAGGFVFVRLAPGGPDFDAFIAPMRAEFATYRTAEMRPLGRVTLRERAVNWKVAVENYVDVLHLPVAHKGLWSLVGNSYTLAVDEDGTCRIGSKLQRRTATGFSPKAYCRHLPDAAHLPAQRRDAWVYVKLWPNLAFDLYPDQIDFMQFIPVSPRRTLLREISYALPDDRREMRAARYLNWRINRVVNAEDKALIERVQAGMEAPGYAPGPMPRSEPGLRDFAARWRAAMADAPA